MPKKKKEKNLNCVNLHYDAHMPKRIKKLRNIIMGSLMGAKLKEKVKRNMRIVGSIW